jgi:hypothetical protein
MIATRSRMLPPARPPPACMHDCDRQDHTLREGLTEKLSRLRHHTKTLANMYSRVHWRWIRQSGRPAEAISGEQIVRRKLETLLLAATGG